MLVLRGIDPSFPNPPAWFSGVKLRHPSTRPNKIACCVLPGDVFSLFRTRITTCYSDRVEAGPDFVLGLPHVVAHSRRYWERLLAERYRAAQETTQEVLGRGASAFESTTPIQKKREST